MIGAIYGLVTQFNGDLINNCTQWYCHILNSIYHLDYCEQFVIAGFVDLIFFNRITTKNYSDQTAKP